jgi:uncharacterized protein YprB with RNaseH-like and TPR domain
MTSQLDHRLSHLAALRPARNAPARSMTEELPAAAGALAERLGATIESNPFGEHLRLRRWFDRPESCVLESGALNNGALALLAPDAPAQASDPSQWLFLDTETTGLAGGTGTYAFLIGLAWWEAGGLQVEQLFLRDYSEEHAVLTALVQRMAERPVLVTFNGRSFDWPLLETRYRMTRRIEPYPPLLHIDLLHPARHLWRLKLGSVRLAELERNVLGKLPWQRTGDIPGSLIPQAYFDYLHGGAPDALQQVCQHNQMDLRGLAALAARVVEMIATPEALPGDALELYGLSRLVHRRGDRGRARDLYERALLAGLPGEADRAARRELAALAKRAGDLARATSLWEEILGDTRDGLDAYEQLAIYYEHHAREPERAEGLAREALAALRQARAAGRIEPAKYRRLAARLEHRLARLARRAGRKPGALIERAVCEPFRRAGESK